MYQPGHVPLNPADLSRYLQEELQKISAETLKLENLQDFADDTAAEAGGIGVGEFYRTNSTVKIRVS